MRQTAAELESDIRRFQEVFGEVAPEFTKPLIIDTPSGKREVPYKLVKLGKDSDYDEERAIFEAREEVLERDFSDDDEPAGAVVKIDYSGSYGLKLRRMRYVHEKSNSLISGELSYQVGELKAVLWAGYSCTFLLSPSNVERQLSREQHFDTGISIVAANGSNNPQLATVTYGMSQQIPLNAEFPSASFKDAKEGAFEMRREEYDTIPVYERTYFQWENLVGAKVGRTRFKGEGVKLDYKRWLATVNSQQWISVEDTPYAAKITHSPDRRHWGEGRLRFHRRDTETGELWMFSVPEWLNKEEFIQNLNNDTFDNLCYKYPVRFWVRQSGQEREEVFTWGKRDLPLYY